ncbi:P-loop ATPase, Sll1717 family [Pseudoroseomonas sp. WGS1072]|uniref:P-loop ATPase, Sll1717 family n=1 Tax=Roseomonas sp. WGS1072 TaxID=3366816 RepID=UPI003BEF7AD0
MIQRSGSSNPVILRRGSGIGSGNAETDDDFLFECFISYPAVDTCRRPSSPAMVIAGRTGAGKTAILRYLENEGEHTSVVDPFEMSMSYVSNSDALRFLQAIGADLDLLFQVLWKHVLCLEFIRLRWGVENSEKSVGIFSRIIDRFSRDQRKNKAIEYLRTWQGKFWITMDQNIKEMTESVEKKLRIEVGGEIDKFKAGGQYDRRMSREKKSEIVARTRKIISADLLTDLHSVIDLLSVPDGDGMKTFYIMVDKLDEKWVDDGIRFRLIKALLESLRSFRKIPNLKILVALRSDVLERVVQETADITFQREKFEDAMVRLVWSKGDMRRLVETRLNNLLKRQYTSESIGFDDLFPNNISGKNTFDWMLERTMMRPRDMISFVNEAIDAADGHSTISVTALRKAEMEFARKRRDALIQEWRSAFPTLEMMLSLEVSKRRPNLDALELLDKIDDFSLNIVGSTRQGFDPIHDICSAYLDNQKKSPEDVLEEILAALYRTGAIGIKLTAQDRFLWAQADQPLIAPSVISLVSKIRIHPMLHAAYNLR